MPDFVITCPTPACGKPLRLPDTAVGKPLYCPHCRTPIRVTLGPDGTPASVSAPDRLMRVPRMLMVPGFALLILGVAGAFVNGYIAFDCLAHPPAAREHANRYVREFNNLDQQLNFNKKPKKDDEASEHELFMAAAGGGAGATVLIAIEEAMTDAWTPRMQPVHLWSAFTSLLAAVAGWCILRGRYYALCLLGCLSAMLTVGQACCVPGVVAGVWGFLTLVRDDGRAHFGIRPKTP
jgi:hypothetical protein